MNLNLDQALNAGSILITLYVIAVALIYLVFIRTPSESK